jgi:hypothetical protein
VVKYQGMAIMLMPCAMPDTVLAINSDAIAGLFFKI